MKLNPETLRYLTTERADSAGNPTALLCDIQGKALASGVPAVAVYDDASGKAWARAAAVLPSNSDPISRAQRTELLELGGVLVDDDDANVRGYYVPAPDFTLAGKAAAEKVHA